MLYIDLNSTNVYDNFGLEYYLATEHKLEEPIFLFWRTCPTVMLGRYQNIYEEVNLPYIEAHQIKLVRRYSGGGCIYTDLGGWQYTFIQESSSQQIEFAHFIQPVVTALRGLGLDVGFSGRNDLLLDGKKISGTAQYKLGDRTVHHGSLLFSTDITEMVKATSPDPYKIESKGIKSVRERVGNIQDYLEEAISPESFKALMVQAILGEGSPYQLTEAEADRARALGREKFQERSAIYGLNPQFTAEKSRRFPGGRLTIRYQVKQGLIQDIQFTGDFFATDRLPDLEAAFLGHALDRQELTAALARAAEGKRPVGSEDQAQEQLLELSQGQALESGQDQAQGLLLGQSEDGRPKKEAWNQVIRGISLEDIVETLLN